MTLGQAVLAGSGGLTRRQVVEVQRARLIASAIDVLVDGGYEALTVASVIQRARVSRKTFYEIFANCDECFEAVFEHVSARGASVVQGAIEGRKGWLAATRSALSGLLSLIDEEPALAKIWFVDSLAGPPAVLRQRAQTMSVLAGAIHRGRALVEGSEQPPRLLAEGAVGGIAHIIHTRLLEKSSEPLLASRASLMYMIVLPYLGQARARAELKRRAERPSSRRARVQPPSLDESLHGLKIRLTYRTIRTITTVFEQPGASNLEVSVGCGIKDQGQISKLLTRLEGLGLIENRGMGRNLGAPNAWHITDRGSDLVQATRLSAPANRSGQHPLPGRTTRM